MAFAGYSASSRNHLDHVGKRGLIAIVPVGALRRVLVEMLLVVCRVGRDFVEPLTDTVATPDEKSEIVLGH